MVRRVRSPLSERRIVCYLNSSPDVSQVRLGNMEIKTLLRRYVKNQVNEYYEVAEYQLALF